MREGRRIGASCPKSMSRARRSTSEVHSSVLDSSVLDSSVLDSSVLVASGGGATGAQLFAAGSAWNRAAIHGSAVERSIASSRLSACMSIWMTPPFAHADPSVRSIHGPCGRFVFWR